MAKKTKKTVNEKISEALDLVPEVVDTFPVKVEGKVVSQSIVPYRDENSLGFPTPGENPEIQADYESARKHLQVTQEQAIESLEQMKEVAEQGQQARQYEVIAQLLKVNLEMAKAKIDIHKDMKALRDQEGVKGPNQRAAHIGDVHNSIIVGTTKDLQQLHKQGKLPKEVEGEVTE